MAGAVGKVSFKEKRLMGEATWGREVGGEGEGGLNDTWVVGMVGGYGGWCLINWTQAVGGNERSLGWRRRALLFRRAPQHSSSALRRG